MNVSQPAAVSKRRPAFTVTVCKGENMNNPHIVKITAITKVFAAGGQKCVGAEILYDQPIDPASVSADSFEAEDRTVTGISADGSLVSISLSEKDEKASLYFEGRPFGQVKPATVISAKVLVRQVREIRSADGTVLPAWETADSNTDARDDLADRFIQGSFEGLEYNLFIPEDYDPSKKYPLVQFIHDAAVCGDNVKCALAQGVGALVWVTPEAQKKHPCFVLAPMFAPPTIVDDDFNVDHRLEVEKRLLDKIVSEYSIDTGALYTTGQSMGCMSSMVLNLRYPNLFAASLFVAGQWDERQFQGSGLEKMHAWFINSEGDAKAFPGMNQILWVLEKEGAKVAREVWKTGQSQECYHESAERLAATGANIIYTPYDITTVADGWHSNGGEHHVNTWRHAYFVEAVRDWLFDQHK